MVRRATPAPIPTIPQSFDDIARMIANTRPANILRSGINNIEGRSNATYYAAQAWRYELEAINTGTPPDDKYELEIDLIRRQNDFHSLVFALTRATADEAPRW